MNLTFPELGSHFFGVSDIYVTKQNGDGKTRFMMQNPRPTDAFLLFSNTTGICYQQSAEPLYIPQGALVYMPKNSRYVWENSPANGSKLQENYLFEFTARHIDITRDDTEKHKINSASEAGEEISFSDKVCIVSTRHAAVYKQLFLNLIDCADAQKFTPLRMYSAVYEFFGTVSENCRAEQEYANDISVIRGSIKLLTDSSVPQKSISEIANDCNISISYYERLFRAYIGVSPIEYRHIHRINRIKLLLQQQNITLAEISEKVGYCDSGYLCRFFKQKTGMTPKEYRKIYIQQTQNNLLK